MVRENIINYIGIQHNYLKTNCITIIDDFYTNELGINCIKELIPSDVKNRRWMREVSLKNINDWALKHGIKVPLTEAQDFDVMVFESKKSKYPIHFGMFLKPCKMLHLEEGRTSRYETISNEWADCIFALYRHHDMV